MDEARIPDPQFSVGEKVFKGTSVFLISDRRWLDNHWEYRQKSDPAWVHEGDLSKNQKTPVPRETTPAERKPATSRKPRFGALGHEEEDLLNPPADPLLED